MAKRMNCASRVALRKSAALEYFAPFRYTSCKRAVWKGGLHRMKAIVVSSPRHYELVQRPIPEPPDGWARVKVTAAAFCATDLEVLDGGIKARYPLTPGH